MKAAVYHEHGSADVIKYEDVPKPSPKAKEVLLKIHAASINPIDWRLMQGTPRVIRLAGKLLKMAGQPGVDVAGEVEAVGKDIRQFKPGDKVFGGCRGSLAEYGCSSESKIALKPDNVTYEQAASVNVAGLTALQAVRDKGKAEPGQKVLVNGASGGVGTFAVQIAKHFGADVTGVCSTRNVEMVKSIGADAVIDYTKEDFTQLPARYDVIIECIGNKTLSECRRVLNPKGKHIMIGASHEPSIVEMMVPLFKALLISPFMSRKAIPLLGKARQDDLAFLGELIANGKVTPVIDSRYPLDQAADAMRKASEGHARGKIIVQVMSDEQ